MLYVSFQIDITPVWFSIIKLKKYDLDTLSASCMSLGTEHEAHLFGPLLQTDYEIPEKTNVNM